MLTMRPSIRTSPITATRTCIRAKWFCCALSARDVGSIPSTSTGTTFAFWLATEPDSERERSERPGRTTAFHHDHHARSGHGRNLLLDRPGPELGRLCPQPELR